MDESIFRRLVYLVRDQYPVAAERISAPVVGRGDWYVGRVEATAMAKAAPYIAWIRGDVSFSSPPKSGPKQTTGADAQSVDPLADALQLVTAFICGRDENETELIWYATLNAVRDIFGVNPKLFGPADWVTQNDNNAGYVLAGVEVVAQTFSWSIVVPRAIQPLTVITDTEHECEGIVP